MPSTRRAKIDGAQLSLVGELADSGLIAPSIPISTRGFGVSRTPCVQGRHRARRPLQLRVVGRGTEALRTAIHCHPVTCAPDGGAMSVVYRPDTLATFH